MKKTLLVILVIVLIMPIFGFTESSPTLKAMVVTEPTIPFEFAAEFDEEFAYNVVYNTFGERIASTFKLFEVFDIDIQEDWGIVKFKFIEDFTTSDTVIAIFDNLKETDVLLLEREDDMYIIDFSLIPCGITKMYLMSDYEPSN